MNNKIFNELAYLIASKCIIEPFGYDWKPGTERLIPVVLYTAGQLLVYTRAIFSVKGTRYLVRVQESSSIETPEKIVFTSDDYVSENLDSSLECALLEWINKKFGGKIDE